jgi:hypothetical protein
MPSSDLLTGVDALGPQYRQYRVETKSSQINKIGDGGQPIPRPPAYPTPPLQFNLETSPSRCGIVALPWLTPRLFAATIGACLIDNRTLPRRLTTELTLLPTRCLSTAASSCKVQAQRRWQPYSLAVACLLTPCLLRRRRRA